LPDGQLNGGDRFNKKCQLLSNGWIWNWEWRRDNHFIRELIDSLFAIYKVDASRDLTSIGRLLRRNLIKVHEGGRFGKDGVGQRRAPRVFVGH
jgi:hypothetical protein